MAAERMAGLLAAQILRRVVRGQILVRRRIPQRIVHAVQNPAQVRRALPQQALQLFSELLRLNLLGIFAAHRGQNVGVNHPALEKVEVIELLHFIHGENLPWKQQPLRCCRRKPALVAGVVNRQHHSRRAQHRVGFVDRTQVNRNQRSLPIVHMKNVRHAQQLCSLNQNRPKRSQLSG